MAGASAWKIRDFPQSNVLEAVSCPRPSFCAAVDDAGHVATSTKPAGGRGAWRAVDVAGRDTLGGVSCPAKSLCVAVDSSHGTLISSRQPTRGPRAWTAVPLEKRALSGVSCPSPSLCVATDRAGNILVSRHPSGGSRAWSIERVDQATFRCGPFSTSICHAALIGGISCPTVSFCLAVDDAGNVVSSTDPAGGPSHWTLSAAGLGAVSEPNVSTSSAVSCASIHLCVVVVPGGLDTSTDPTGGQTTWKPTYLDQGALKDVSCTSNSFCVAVDLSGNVLTSTHPSRGGSAWSTKRGVNPSTLTAVSCATRSFCVATDGWGYATVGRNPSG
jgi:hypothetical protein